jgi:hypothetical protein
MARPRKEVYDKISDEQLGLLADNILSGFTIDDVADALNETNFSDYAEKPVEFCREVLKQKLTNDVKKMLRTLLTSRITVAVSANAVGKTHGAACAAIWFQKCREKPQVVMATAPPAERNLKAKLWAEVRSQIKNNPWVFEGDKLTSLSLEDSADPQSFIKGVTIPMSGSEDEREAKFSGMHAPSQLFVLDEGDAIPDEIYRAIESCMSGGFARMLVMFNPKRKLGAVYRMIRDRRCAIVYMSAFSHPNVVTGRDLIPGAVTREQTVKRINEWTAPLSDDEEPDHHCFEVPGFLVGATAHRNQEELYPPLFGGWRRIEEPAFSYMVLGEYPTQSAFQLISTEWIDAARTRWDAYVAKNGENPPVGVKPIHGLDAAELGEDANTLCTRYGGFVKRIRRWTGMDTLATARHGAQFYHEEDGTVVNVDATGVGAGIAPNMNLTFRFVCPKCWHKIANPDLNKTADECPKCSTDTLKVHMEIVFCNAKRIMVASIPTKKTELGEFGVLRDQLWWEVREWLRTDTGAMLPPSEKLVEELTIPDYEIRAGKIKVMDKAKMRKHLCRSPDEADALCLTFAKNDGRPRVRTL